MMLNLLALKRYEHYLNEMATDLGIANFRQLGLYEQCLVAERWTEHQDAKADRANAEGQWT